jgi:hypothetical protein
MPVGWPNGTVPSKSATVFGVPSPAGTSSSRMLTVVLIRGPATTPALGDDSTTSNVSIGSSTVSLTPLTAIVCSVTPAGKVSVPLAAV